MNATAKWIVSALCAVLLIGCGDSSGNRSKGNVQLITDETTGIKYADLVVGTGQTCKVGDYVQIHYTGWLRSGRKFDSSKDSGQPLPIKLGAQGVIKGLDLGIPGMKVGGKRRLVIPPDLAYGTQGRDSKQIPPNAELTFDVELVDMGQMPVAPLRTFNAPPPDQLQSITGKIPPAGELAIDKTGIKFADLVEGSGQACKWGDSVQVDYTGWLKDGKKFDSSKDQGKPLTVKLGEGKVIKGWDLGIPGMKVGGKRKLVLPPEYAYGKRGFPTTIPPDAELTFEVELLGITERAVRPEMPSGEPVPKLPKK